MLWVFGKVYYRCMRCRIKSGMTGVRVGAIVNTFRVVETIWAFEKVKPLRTEKLTSRSMGLLKKSWLYQRIFFSGGAFFIRFGWQRGTLLQRINYDLQQVGAAFIKLQALF